jgi:hypothetical protein
MKPPYDDLPGRTWRSDDGSTTVTLSSSWEPDYEPPSPRPEAGPIPDWLRPHVSAVLGDMQQPSRVELTLGYRADEELEHFGAVLFREPDGSGFGFGVVTNAGEAKLLVALAEGMQDNFCELREAWGQARLECPGHTHAMTPVERDRVAWWTCPADRRRIARIGTLRPRR